MRKQDAGQSVWVNPYSRFTCHISSRIKLGFIHGTTLAGLFLGSEIKLDYLVEGPRKQAFRKGSVPATLETEERLIIDASRDFS